MLGNGFDLYHNLLTHYNDFMTIGEYLCKKYSTINYDNLDKINIYSELEELANKTIQEKLFTYEDAYKESEINKEEYAVFLEKLHTNCWFNYFLDIKNRNGWVDLENQIEKVLREFRQSNPTGIDRFLDVIKENNNYNDAMFKHIKKYSFGMEENNDCIFEEYNEFVEILRQYLKIFVDSVLPHISNLYADCNSYLKNNDYVLTFNYTNTYEELYGSKADIIHIHGKLDDSIVLGINSNEYDDAGSNDYKFIKYKKYYQRITKHTFDGLKKLIRDAKADSFKQKGLFVVGHSLDASDGDIIKVLFELFECIIIYYHDDKALDQYVKNLKIIFGAKELSKMTFSQKIVFQELPPNEFKKVNTNDKL